MMYESSVWTSCNKKLLERVLQRQKLAACIFFLVPLALVGRVTLDKWNTDSLFKHILKKKLR